MKCTHTTILFEHPAVGIRAERQTGPFGVRASPLHFHGETELIYILRGMAVQQINERMFVMRPGSLSVIGPDQRHSLCAAAADSGLEVLVIQFDAQRALDGLAPADEFGRAWLQGELFFPAALQPPPSAVQDLLSIGQELEQELPCCETMVRASLLRLLVYLWRQRPQRVCRDSAGDSSSIDLLAETFRFLSEHYGDEGLTLRQAAEASHLSVSHFCRLFRSATDKSFHDYLNHYRVLRAEPLLHGGRTLTEIAYLCGFGSFSAFSRNYKKYKGCSPRQARRELKAAQQPGSPP